MRIHLNAGFTLLLICFGFTGNASSLGLGPSFTEGLITADFIFKGEVIDVSYRNSTPLSTTNPALAHTFVTCQIDQVFKGSIVPPDPATSSSDNPTTPPAFLALRFPGSEITITGNSAITLIYKLSMPPWVPSGYYSVGAIIDYNNKLTEKTASNNTTYTGIRVLKDDDEI